jgi:restriction system protein
MDNIDNLSGVEFENLCQVLISKMGFDVTPTKITGDGGIDLIAYNEQPIIQGKYIIQCKRYSGSVGEPILRDLYGVVMSERANKGILITTGDFTSSAVHFAEGKALELIDGKKLKALLNQYSIVISNASIANYSSTVRDALRISLHDNAQEEYDYLLQERDKSSDNLIAYLKLIGYAEEAIFTYSVVTSVFDASERINNIKKCREESEKYIYCIENKSIQNKQMEFIHYACLCIKVFHYLKFGELDKALKLSFKILEWNELSKSNAYKNGLAYFLAIIINNAIQIYRSLEVVFTSEDMIKLAYEKR